MEEYPPPNYITYQWWPRYIPLFSSLDYISNWKNGRFAKNLADFIDKVLTATGASQVDIVTHSMGALVARSAIKNYGCSSKVRKLLTVGAPNRPYSGWWEGFYSIFGQDKLWQKSGEDLEMGLNVPSGKDAKFLNIQTGDTNYWCNYLDYNNYIEAISTIMGDRGNVIWGEPNDNAVAVSQSYINSAQFNAVVYEQHSYDNDVPELCETSSSYTTEFIKKWIIDDEVKMTNIATNFAYDARGTGNPYYWAKGCLRIRSAALNYNNSLITLVRLQKKVFKKDKGDTTKTIYDVYTKAFQIYKYSRSFPGDPVFLVNKIHWELGSEYWLTIWDMDMTGEIKYSRERIHLQDGDSSYVKILDINGCYIGHSTSFSWTTNDYAVFQKLYYKKDTGNWVFLDSLNGNVRNYTFTPT